MFAIKSSSSGPGAPQPTMRSFLRLANINKNFPVGHSSGGSSRLDVIESKKKSNYWGAWSWFSQHSLCILEALIYESNSTKDVL